MSRLLAALVFVAASASAQDRDADGTRDDVDLCPDVAEREASVFPGDGCPDADADHDRVDDAYDFCASVPETVNGFEDADGCPDADGAALRELAERIHFATADDHLDASASEIVERIARFLAAHAAIARAEILGAADARGDADANLALSQRRATAVRDALVARGIAAARITATGRGVLPGDSPAIQAENRRCDVRIALDADPRDQPIPAALVGAWSGDALIDVHLGARAGESQLVVRAGAPGWLGPATARFDCYAATAIGDREALVCRGVDREATLVLRTVGAGHVIGAIEVRSAAGIDRAGWSGHTGPTVGDFDAQIVVRMIARYRREIQACYETELRDHPTLAGRMTVQMTIAPSGETVLVHVVDVTPPGLTAIGPCVVAVIDRMAFSPGPIGGSVSFTFPFVFEPQS